MQEGKAGSIVSSKDKALKFKFRVRVSDDADCPFVVERKALIFWYKVTKVRSENHAKEEILKLIKLETRRPGTVVSTYTEKDYLADKLKGDV